MGFAGRMSRVGRAAAAGSPAAGAPNALRSPSLPKTSSEAEAGTYGLLQAHELSIGQQLRHEVQQQPPRLHCNCPPVCTGSAACRGHAIASSAASPITHLPVTGQLCGYSQCACVVCTEGVEWLAGVSCSCLPPLLVLESVTCTGAASDF